MRMDGGDMEIAALFTVIASLRVVPDRAQFFWHDSVSLSCEAEGHSDWKIKRNTSKVQNSDCLGRGNASHCSMEDLYPFDSGVYWCQSASGQSSNTVNITVTNGSIILDIPALPVLEGEDVTLRCRCKTTHSSLTAAFYKDGIPMGHGSSADMTIHRVSKSDEGLYRCNVSGVGVSAESLLALKDPQKEHPPFRFAQVALPAVGACLSLACLTLLLLLQRRQKGETEAEDVVYADVFTITRDFRSKSQRGVNAMTTYTGVKPGNA